MPILIAVGLVVAVAAAASAFALRVSGSDSTIGGIQTTYSEGVAGTWQRVNPLFADTNDVDADLSQLVFSGLVRLGPDGSVQPDLADLPIITDNGTTYTFKLRKNAKWHDGQPVTSQDVAFTISKLTDPDFKGDPDLAAGWIGLQTETPDDRTFVVHLKQASAPFLARNATIGILPQHLLQSLSAADLEVAPFNAAPIGSGPYKLTEIDAKSATLEANPDFYLGAPKITSIKIKFYSDYSSAIQGLASGDVEGLMVRDTLTEQQLTDLRSVKGMTVDALQRGDYLAFYLNNDRADFFGDERVRQAISLALDRKAIIDKEMLGISTPSSSPIAPGTWAYAPEFDKTAPDVATAKKLLADAGWTPQVSTGILVRNGTEFRFTIRTDNDPTRIAVAEEIAKELEPLGIRATVASTTFSVLRRDFLQQRQYDAAVALWSQGADPDPYFGWHSSQMGTAGLNLANFADTVADELISKARTTNDIDVRKDLYRQFQEVWNEVAPSAVIGYPQYLYVHTDALKDMGLGVMFDGSDRFLNVYKWHE